MKTRHLFIAATAVLALASCTSDNFVGDESLQNGNANGVISFNMSTPTMTRATGKTAANLLGNQFVVFGYKTMSDNSNQTVFNNYQANYVDNTASTTTSNSANWEYVGYKHLHANMTGYTGVAGNATGDDYDQTIKYWDYGASNYKYYAYSLGTGKSGASTTYANASLMSTSDTYTLEGDQDQLSACYISELQQIVPSSSLSTEVELKFLSLLSKIQLGFYETIPGYSVKTLKFYDSASDDTSDGTPVLYAGSSTLPKAGTYTITFDGEGKPQLAWAAAASDGTQANVSFSSTLTNYAARDYQEAIVDNTYLGRSSNAATMTEEKSILPYATGADLTLKVDYTLISRDGSGETIEAKGATATIPAAFTQWKPNYKYTYLFKISENSNPLIGSVTGLYPITLDAVVADAADGSQETITTVAEPSITSYAKASAVLSKDEYVTGNNIYVIVEDGATNPALTVSTNAKLYYVTVEEGAAQSITEETVKNALAKGTLNATDKTWTVKDALDKKLVVTDTESSLLTAITEIPATDSPTGVDLSVNGAYFKPANTYVKVTKDEDLTEGVTYYTSDEGAGGSVAGASAKATDATYRKAANAIGYYVFEYWRDAVGNPCVAATGTFVTDTKYYTDNTGETEVDTSSFVDGKTDVTSYYVKNSSYKPAVKIYKVIKVVD